MDREHLGNLLEAVRSTRAGVFQMEQELLAQRLADGEFRENLPTFICVVQAPILDDAQKEVEDGLRKPRHWRWL